MDGFPVNQNPRLYLSETMRVQSTLRWCLGLVTYGVGSYGVFWFFYDLRPLILGGYVTWRLAAERVAEMAMVVLILTVIAWAWSGRAKGKPTLLRRWWSAAWRTALILFLYAAVVLVRRETWTAAQNTNDQSMFFGQVNAFFLAEFRWLSFLLQVLPCLAVLSGMLFGFADREASTGYKQTASTPENGPQKPLPTL